MIGDIPATSLENVCNQTSRGRDAVQACCSIATWNLNAMPAHFDELLALNHDVTAIQEVRANERQLAQFAQKARSHGFQLIAGPGPKVKKYALLQERL